MKKKLTLVDLDDTLIDTLKFKSELFGSLAQKSGLKMSEVIEIYESIKRNEVLNIDWHRSLIKTISKKTEQKPETLFLLLKANVKKIEIKTQILKLVKEKTGTKYILTVGDPKIQKAKINTLNLSQHFDGVIYLKNRKDKYVLSLIKNESLILDGKIFNEVEIIDDKDHLLDSLLKFPWIKVIHPDHLK